MPRTARPDDPGKKPRRVLGARSDPPDVAAYEQFMDITSDCVWRFDVVPSVSTKLPPREQAIAFLGRARLGFCNSAFAQFCGFETPMEIIGRPIGDIFPEAGSEMVEFVAQIVAKGYRCTKLELASPTSEGNTVWTLNNVAGVVKRGRLVACWGAAIDISEAKAIEAALRAGEERLNLALSAASDGVYDIDLRTGESYYSPGYYTMLGFAPNEFPPSQEAWEGLLHPEDKQRALDMLARCVTGDAHEAETEFRLHTKGGEWRHIVSRGRVVARDEDGTPRRLVGTHRDVTAQWEAGEEVRRERDRAQAYLDIAEVMLVALDHRGRIALINRKGCQLVGFDEPSELIGKDWFETCVPRSDAERAREVFGRLMAGDVAPVERYENPIVARSGELREMAWHNALLRDSDGRVAGTLSSGEDITERHKAEETLGKTASLLSKSEEISHVGSWELDLVADRLIWSDELYRIFGLAPQETPPSNETFYSILHPEDREAVGAAYEDALAEGKDAYENLHRLIRPRTGEVRSIHEKCVFVRDGAGTPVRVFGIVQDITERQRAEAAVLASEEKYRLLVENATEAVFVAQDGMLKFLNPATARIIGRSTEELRARPFAEFIHPDDCAFVMERHRRRLVGEGVEGAYGFRVVHADGIPRWVEIRAVQIEWEGRPASLNFVSDISERRAAEEAQRGSEERFRRIFEESPIGMVTVGLDFRFTRANSAFCDMIGYTESELLTKSFVDITHPEHVGSDVESVKRVARGEIPSYRTEKRYIRKDGRIVWGALTATAMRDAGGRVQYFLSMIEDITARKQTEAALAESERKYRDLANDLPTCVFEAGLDGRVTYANRTGLEWFGYAEEEIVGHKRITDMVAEGERERAVRTMRRAVEDGEIPAGEYTAVRRDGSTFPALVSSRAIMHEGKPVGVRGILIDITERVEAARRVERALAGTIHALAITTEMRDPYTAGHQERVTKVAVAIGRKMELPEIRLEGLRVAGQLHDVGKVSVPAEILSKPTELTQIEFALVKSHPETGHVILREIEFPWPVATIVLQHHERMDGSGYPSGLRGEEVLLEARILAVADTVEAMASHRPYRAAFGIAEALAEVARGSGSSFDAGVASACQALFAEDGFQWDA